MIRRPPRSTLFPYTDALPISDSYGRQQRGILRNGRKADAATPRVGGRPSGCKPLSPGTNILDRKSTRLNSSHANISYAVFCLKKTTISMLPYIHIHYTVTLSY